MRPLDAVQLSRREAEPDDALQFRDQRIETARTPRGDYGLHDRFVAVLGAGNSARPAAASRNGGLRLRLSSSSLALSISAKSWSSMMSR